MRPEPFLGRPRYETTDHKLSERKIYERLEKAWKRQIFSNPSSYGIDAAVCLRGEVEAWMEVKCRNGKSDLYDTYYIAASKWRSGVAMAQITGIPYLLVMHWSGDDRIMICKVKPDTPQLASGFKIQVRWGGRTVQKRDPADIEPMVHIPRQAFTNAELP
jgi:hypothetical protein